jgi:hypothetical protein
MSFYQTTNASIVRFRTVPRKLVAPFEALQRVVTIQQLTASTYASAAASIAAGAALTPEQLQNGALIIPSTQTAGQFFGLPTAYALQQYFGGRFAFNMAANQVNVGAGANQLNGNNDFFLFNVYNLSTNTTTFVNGNNSADVKVIAVAPAANDASMTPILLRFSGVNSPLATINGVANTVSYTIF